jgi:tripartite-type tricarboxylate transporter receptor subunit TctC
MATMPALIRKPSFDVLNDFDYLGMIHEVPMTIVARPTLEANDYKQLSAWVSSQKDKVNLGNAGIGSASHLCGLLWQSSMRTEMTTINYKGVSMAMNDLLGGQIDVLCDQTTNTLAYIESRKIKAYAVTSNKRLPQAALKDLPTLQEVGLKGFQVSVWHAVYAPKGLPPETKAKLYSALRSVLSDAAFIQKQEARGAVMIIDKRTDPAEHKKFVAAEIAKWSPIIKAAGVYAD